jgi:DNA-binding NarL/FixJ family response regulator
LLEAHGIEVLAEASTAAEAMERLNPAPDVVLMDVGLPDEDGVSATVNVLQACPQTRVLIITMFHDDLVVARALEAGAAGYVVKDASPDEVVGSVLGVAGGSLVIGHAVADQVRRMATGGALRASTPEEGRFPELTDRERQVVGLIGKGLTNAQVAERLGVSGKTVANYVSAILTRLHVRDRQTLADLVR